MMTITSPIIVDEQGLREIVREVLDERFPARTSTELDADTQRIRETGVSLLQSLRDSPMRAGGENDLPR